VFSLEKSRIQGIIRTHLIAGVKKIEPLFSVVPSDRPKGKEHKWKYSKFP